MTLKVDHYRVSTVPSDEGDEGDGALSSLDGVAVVLRVRVVGAVVEVEDVDAVDAAVVHGVGGADEPIEAVDANEGVADTAGLARHSSSNFFIRLLKFLLISTSSATMRSWSIAVDMVVGGNEWWW